MQIDLFDLLKPLELPWRGDVCDVLAVIPLHILGPTEWGTANEGKQWESQQSRRIAELAAYKEWGLYADAIWRYYFRQNIRSLNWHSWDKCRATMTDHRKRGEPIWMQLRRSSGFIPDEIVESR